MILPFSKKTFVVIVMKMVVWKSPWDKSGGNLPLTAGYNRHSEYRWSQKPKTFTKADCKISSTFFIMHVHQAFVRNILRPQWEVKKYAFTFIREVKSENVWLSLFFKRCKVKGFCHSFLRSEMLIENDSRSRSEVSREILRNLEKRDLFCFFCLPKSALNMVWNLISPPHRRYVQGWVTDNTRIHSFSKNRSEKYIAFNFSRSEKWKQYSFHFLLRSESEIELNRNREREVEFVKKKISRIL